MRTNLKEEKNEGRKRNPSRLANLEPRNQIQ